MTMTLTLILTLITSQSREKVGRQAVVRTKKMVAEAGTVRKPRGRRKSAVETATKQRLVKTLTEYTSLCVIVIYEV
jgi:hypothetical protein